MHDTIDRVASGQDLSQSEATSTATQLVTTASDAQIAGFLMALRTKGVTPAELAGFAEGIQSKAETVETDIEPLVDTCGTGGDAFDTFNVSTTSALLCAAMDIPVAKHGNRSVSSSSGSSDVLEELGIRLDVSPSTAAEMLSTVGFSYLHAPSFHPAMANVADARNELGVSTIFNLVGPLTNPAGASSQIIGVYDEETLALVAEAASRMDIETALIVHGDGIDEIAIHGPTEVAEVQGGTVSRYQLTPEELGLDRAPIDEIAGGTPAENAAITREVLGGDRRDACRDIVAANAGAAAYVAGEVGTISDGVELAEETLESGSSAAMLDRLTSGVTAE